MKKSKRLLTPEYMIKKVETGACGAIIGTMVFTVIAGFITNGQPVALMRYSPLIGCLVGGLISLILTLVCDLKEIREFQAKIATMKKEKKIAFLQGKLNAHIYPLQRVAIDELKRIDTPKAYQILKEASKK